MKKEDLIALGLTEEQAEAVIKSHTEELTAAKKTARQEGENFAKSAYEKSASESTAKLTEELESVKAAASKSAAELEELKKKYADDTAALKADRDGLEKNYLIDSALTARQAKNLKAAKALLDLDKVSLKDGKLEGLEEQLEAVVKENGYMFGASESVPQFMKSTQNPSGLDGAEGKGLTYSQMMAIKAQNPNAEI